MSRSAIKVAVRTRPTAQFAQDEIAINTEAAVRILTVLAVGWHGGGRFVE
jgi:hypothetical protein